MSSRRDFFRFAGIAGGAVAGWYEHIDMESSQQTEQALESLKEARPFW